MASAGEADWETSKIEKNIIIKRSGDSNKSKVRNNSTIIGGQRLPGSFVSMYSSQSRRSSVKISESCMFFVSFHLFFKIP